MFKDLVSVPLQQTLMLLWFVGLTNLVRFPVKEGYCSLGWIFSALLAGLLSLLMAARLRQPMVLCLAIILGLGSILASFYLIGGRDLSRFGLWIALYGLFLWGIAIWMLHHPLTKRVLKLFRLSGGYGQKGGLKTVEIIIRWSCFTIIITAVTVGVGHNLFVGQVPFAPLLIVVFAMLFLMMAGKRYGSRFYSYLFIAFGAWSTVTLLAMAAANLNSPPAAVVYLSVTDPRHGLFLALFGFAILLLGGWLIRPLLEKNNWQKLISNSLYTRPLLVSAVVSAYLAAAQEISLAVTKGLHEPGWVALACCAIAAFILLTANHLFQLLLLTLSGVGLSSITLLWLYSAVFHNQLPLGFWPHGQATADQWLVLSLLSFALAILAYKLRQSKWQRLYQQPIFIVALLFYGLSCLGGFSLFIDESAKFPFLPLLLLVLIAGLFPLLHRFCNSAEIRGIGIALLLSLLIASLLDSASLRRQEIALFFCGWAYVLWTISNLLLPKFNFKFPQWAISVNFWPWLGLLSLALGLSLASQPVILQWNFTLCIAGFFFLMTRNSFWPGFRWLAIISLTWSGLVFSGTRYLLWGASFSPTAITMLALENLLWVNGLLLLVPWWRRKGANLLKELDWRQTDFEQIIQECALGVCCLWLVWLAGWEGQILLYGSSSYHLTVEELFIGGLLSISLLHCLWWSHSTKVVHFLLAALFCTLLAAWSYFCLFPFPIFLALWSGLLLVADWRLKPNKTIDLQLIARPLRLWLQVSLLLTLLTVIIIPDLSISARLITLVAWSINVALLGYRQQSRIWLIGAALIFIIILHGIWFIRLEFNMAAILLPWFSLELITLAGILNWLRTRIIQQAGKIDYEQGMIRCLIGEIISQISPFIIGLALLEWLLHFYILTASLIVDKKPQWLVNFGDPIIALLAISLLTVWFIQLARTKNVWIYGLALLAGFATVYIRFLWIGLTPFCVWDTTVLMAAAYGLFILQHFFFSRPILNMVLFLPLLALITVFFQQDSYACLTLMIAGALYMLTRRATGRGIFLYFGLLAFNGAIYIWVPDLIERFGLFQVYLIPAALTVLLLTHLHRHELKPNVLNGTRLAALSILYSVATLDVFLVDNLTVFILALLLSMSGLIVGIALRIRAFFYSGTAFLILNVIGQLMRLYPEQRLGRALILMGLGTIITGVMIWFNMKREVIIQRIRLYQTDLETWQ